MSISYGYLGMVNSSKTMMIAGYKRDRGVTKLKSINA